jgi:hypothetical protein
MFCHPLGQHLKKTSLSESSSDMMDLEDGVESTPGLLSTDQTRLAPFLGAQHIITSDKQYHHSLLPPTLLPQPQQQNLIQQTLPPLQPPYVVTSMLLQQQQHQNNLLLQQQPNCKQPNSGQNLQQRHNSALAVSIETDV